MDKPTQKQIKKFWEGYGLYKKNGKVEWWAELPFPPIDLNNLFKYAMAKLDQSRYYKALSSIFLKNDDPALALFWALWQVKEVKNGRKDNIS